MTILGIETATESCSSAIVVDGRVVGELVADRPRAHAELLLSQIEAVLSATGLTLQSLDGLAVSIGPGSFTGLRIGLSVVKGLAWVTGKPLIAVSTLRALARKSRDTGEPGESGLLLTLLAARKDELYCRLDRKTGGTLTTVWEERAGRAEEIVRELEGKRVVVTGDSSQLLAVLGTADNFHILTGEASHCSAGPVALEGEAALARGESSDIRLLEPRYIKEFEPKLKQRTVLS